MQVLVLKSVMMMGKIEATTIWKCTILFMKKIMYLQFSIFLTIPNYMNTLFLFKAVAAKIIYNLWTRKTLSVCLGSVILQKRNWGLGQFYYKISNFIKDLDEIRVRIESWNSSSTVSIAFIKKRSFPSVLLLHASKTRNN